VTSLRGVLAVEEQALRDNADQEPYVSLVL